MFEDRQQAGFLLARKLEKFADENDILVLGLARGGVVTAKIISTFLNLPLEALVVKKIGAPHNLELAIGAVGPKNTIFWNKEICKNLEVSNKDKNKLKKIKILERNMQEVALRGNKPLDISGKTVILVDDGVATGASVLVSLKFIKNQGAKKVILATPIIAKDVFLYIKRYFDIVIKLKTIVDFEAVGQFYEYFPQVENSEIVKLLK